MDSIKRNYYELLAIYQRENCVFTHKILDKNQEENEVK